MEPSSAAEVPVFFSYRFGIEFESRTLCLCTAEAVNKLQILVATAGEALDERFRNGWYFRNCYVHHRILPLNCRYPTGGSNPFPTMVSVY